MTARRGCWSRLLLCLAVAGAGGCSAGTRTDMQLLRISPGRIPLGQETTLTVTGKHLHPSLRIDLDSKDSAGVSELVGWVGAVGPLAVVAVAGTEELRIVAPATLRLGQHGIVVQDAVSGSKAELPDAVEVFDQENGATDASVTVASDGSSTDVPIVADAGTVTGLVDAAAACPVSHGGVCWYLGSLGATCDQTCESHGGYDVTATSFIGTAAQGGSAEQCAAILRLLGYDQVPATAMRPDVGVGCHLWAAEQQAYWLSEPNFAPNVGISLAQVVCGCKS